MPGPVGSVVSGIEGGVMGGVAVGGGGRKTRRRAVGGRGEDVGGRRGVWGGVRGG